VPATFWRNRDAFVRDLRGADDEQLRFMHGWATEREANADRRGMGRNPKARRDFRLCREAAEAEMERRGIG
jgi:hypothetical protein